MDRQKAAYKEEYYRELEVYVDKINAVRHDMKNQLLAVYDTTEEQGSSGARRMIEGMLQDIRTADEEVYSSNPVLNSILKVKAGKARQHDLESLDRNLCTEKDIGGRRRYGYPVRKSL